ncbi:leucyl aminopeptidase (plasmid) [Legionella sp. PC1000]|uniref:Probable cytosol aminopeptidase n=1 Tax=Legionella resiliens TaxID=2905958 RepID=A0A977J6I8_9GAMM|nr:leucyl aminopeptidase [Legionella sp. PC1000]QLZ70035.1 leucyl aminopeptidase [Legionella sp. PC1000]QLZ70936.1 leucyl aminopeptidase [Legionella sp. PC1000]UWX38860.1 Cytosol aminopeptidase [Legionella sp. 8cVS16]
MNYGLTHKPTLSTSECLVLGVFSDAELTDFALTLDKEHHGLISRLIKKTSDTGDTQWHHDVHGSIFIIQCGEQTKFTPPQLKKRLGEITGALIKHRIRTATVCLPLLTQYSADWQLEQMVIQIDNQCYQLLDFKKKKAKPHQLETITFYLPNASEEGLKSGQAIAAGVELTRHLANMPANICTPTYLGEQALQLAKQFTQHMNCKVMGPDEMRKMGMETLLAVAQGSAQPPRLIDIHYKGAGDLPPIILVGKGITFDSGGLSIKPANAMDEMKYDMSGAASVLGALKACALLKLPINVIGLIASAENMVSGTSVKSGDIVTSMSGQTVEIINTDAEGRLVLADALTYAERYQPQFVIDVATLTGGVIVALGTVASGFMTQDEELAQLIENAAKESNDRVWRMPLDDEYQDALDSPLADMINAGFDRTASSVTAACFLSRFTEKYRWAHLDIAGTAWVFGKNRNATGRPVPLLTQIIRHAANSC